MKTKKRKCRGLARIPLTIRGELGNAPAQKPLRYGVEIELWFFISTFHVNKEDV